jgi:hypothetical protein
MASNKSNKGLDCFDIVMCFCLLNGLQLVLARFDAFRCQCETKVRNFLVSENAFVQVDLKVILEESIQYLLKYF